MSKVWLVKYFEYDDVGVCCAFTSEEEADRYAKAMEEESDSTELHFYSTEIELYNTCEDIDG